MNLRVVIDAFTCVTLASRECVSCREELVAPSELSAPAIHALVGVDGENDRGGVSRAGMGVEVGSEKGLCWAVEIGLSEIYQRMLA